MVDASDRCKSELLVRSPIGDVVQESHPLRHGDSIAVPVSNAHYISKHQDHLRSVVRDLQRPNLRIYWFDLLVTAFVGWKAFVSAVLLPCFSLRMIGATVIAVLALYRALCFVHEISHQNRRLPGFETVWNVVAGFPLLMPSCVYAKIDWDHHSVARYGTAQDPDICRSPDRHE
jgi:hypothetical protein